MFDITKYLSQNTTRLSPSERDRLLQGLNDKLLPYAMPAIVLSIVLIILGAVGNMLVIHIYLNHYKRTSSTYFVLCLACYSFIICVIILPIDTYMNANFYDYRDEIGCKVYRLGTNSLFEGFSFTMVFVAMDRYLKVYRPFYHLKGSTIILVCFLLWVLALCCNIPFAILVFGIDRDTTEIPGLRLFRCLIKERAKKSLAKVVSDLFLVILYLALIVLLAIFYGRIWCYVRKRKKTAIGASMHPELRHRLNRMAMTKSVTEEEKSTASLSSDSRFTSSEFEYVHKSEELKQTLSKNIVSTLMHPKASLMKLVSASKSEAGMPPVAEVPSNLSLQRPGSDDQKLGQSTTTADQSMDGGRGTESVVNTDTIMELYRTARHNLKTMHVASVENGRCETSLNQPKLLPNTAGRPEVETTAPCAKCSPKACDPRTSPVRTSKGASVDIPPHRATPASENPIDLIAKTYTSGTDVNATTVLDIVSQTGSDTEEKPTTAPALTFHAKKLSVKNSAEITTSEKVFPKTSIKESAVDLSMDMTEETHPFDKNPKELAVSDIHISTTEQTGFNHNASETQGVAAASAQDCFPVKEVRKGSDRHVTYESKRRESPKPTTGAIEMELSSSEDEKMLCRAGVVIKPAETVYQAARVEDKECEGVSTMTASTASSAHWNPVSRTTVSLFMVTVVFFICNICAMAIVVFDSSQVRAANRGEKRGGLSSELRLGIVFLVFKVSYFQYALNPVIYMVRQPKFRYHVLKLFKSKCCKD